QPIHQQVARESQQDQADRENDGSDDERHHGALPPRPRSGSGDPNRHGLIRRYEMARPFHLYTGGLRDWSEQEEEVNGSFGSPHHGNRGAAATMPQKHRTLCRVDLRAYIDQVLRNMCVLIARKKASHTMSDGTKICRVACANLRSPNNYY